MLSPENEDLSRKFILEGILFAHDLTARFHLIAMIHLQDLVIYQLSGKEGNEYWVSCCRDGRRTTPQLSHWRWRRGAATALINHADDVDKRHRQ